jgi:hypothetical protein
VSLCACSGIFDPFGFAKGDFKELQTKEIKNGGVPTLPGQLADCVHASFEMLLSNGWFMTVMHSCSAHAA